MKYDSKLCCPISPTSPTVSTPSATGWGNTHQSPSLPHWILNQSELSRSRIRTTIITQPGNKLDSLNYLDSHVERFYKRRRMDVTYKEKEKK